MMMTQSFPNTTTMFGMRKGKQKGGNAMPKKGGYDGGTSGPPMKKASTSGTKGYPEKGKAVKTGKPSRTMY